MKHLELYDTECLVIVSDGIEDVCWVIRREGVSPLPTKHRVRKKHEEIAKALFHAHPKGIERISIADLHYKEGEKWVPEKAVHDKVEVVEN